MDLKTANRLQQLRKENGYSQDALAEKLGLSRQAISKWERGESSPDTDNLIALAELYADAAAACSPPGRCCGAAGRAAENGKEAPRPSR